MRTSFIYSPKTDEIKGKARMTPSVPDDHDHDDECASSETKPKVAKVEAILSTIVGLEDIKLQLRDWAKGLILDETRRSLGIKISAKKAPHMTFLGNPGTGKTMVARVMGRLLHLLGILPTDKVIEVQRTDLVARYTGQTGPKTREKIEEAMGGILFVDEAYRLMPTPRSEKRGHRDFGLEALEEIMSVMEHGKIVVIFAGYSEPMNDVISSNEGFRRRVTKSFVFSDFSSAELAHILHVKMNNQAKGSPLYGFKLHPSCTVAAITRLIGKETTADQRKERNGGLIEPMLVNARQCLDCRLDYDNRNVDDLITITLKDLKEGLILLINGKTGKRQSTKKEDTSRTNPRNEKKQNEEWFLGEWLLGGVSGTDFLVKSEGLTPLENESSNL